MLVRLKDARVIDCLSMDTGVMDTGVMETPVNDGARASSAAAGAAVMVGFAETAMRHDKRRTRLRPNMMIMKRRQCGRAIEIQM